MLCRILLVDDSPLFRAGLRALLEQKKDYVIVGEAGDGLKAITLAEQLKPNIIVLDMLQHALDSEEVLGELQLRVPSSRVLILSDRKSVV